MKARSYLGLVLFAGLAVGASVGCSAQVDGAAPPDPASSGPATAVDQATAKTKQFDVDDINGRRDRDEDRDRDRDRGYGQFGNYGGNGYFDNGWTEDDFRNAGCAYGDYDCMRQAYGYGNNGYGY